MKKIPLTKGKFAIVDDEDYEFLMQRRWYAHKTGYAVCCSHKEKGKRSTIRMQRAIMKPVKSLMVDHINGDKLDNRRSNLRLCNNSQNKMNGRRYAGSFSKYKGVIFRKDAKSRPWQARIKAKTIVYNLGFYDTEIEAAIAYNVAAPKYHREFARLNDIDHG